MEPIVTLGEFIAFGTLSLLVGVAIGFEMGKRHLNHLWQSMTPRQLLNFANLCVFLAERRLRKGR